MRGQPPLHNYYYDLKNIPWTMFYNYDYALHGTYWHDKFGTPQSAGCTNMTQGDAKYILTIPYLCSPKIKKAFLLATKITMVPAPLFIIMNNYPKFKSNNPISIIILSSH